MVLVMKTVHTTRLPFSLTMEVTCKVVDTEVRPVLCWNCKRNIIV